VANRSRRARTASGPQRRSHATTIEAQQSSRLTNGRETARGHARVRIRKGGLTDSHPLALSEWELYRGTATRRRVEIESATTVAGLDHDLPSHPLDGRPGKGRTTSPLCPAAFVGPLTFQQVVDQFPPPPGIPIDEIFAALDSFDKNDDDSLCVLDLPGDEINVVDNVANTH
jgi:hypothetical protein